MPSSKISSVGFRALLVTQFLEAFNDNAFKMVVSFIAVDHFVGKSGGTIYLSLIGMAFILPFLLFSTYAGYLADRFSKQKVFLGAKIAEIFIMIAGLFGLLSGNIWILLVVLFLLGTHSAFFSPSKYGILPEILNEEELSEGNGHLQMWTYAAIILGQAAGGYLIQMFAEETYKTCYVFISIAVIGLITCLYVAKVKPSGTDRKLEWNFVRELVENVRWIKPNRLMFLSILGLVYFGFLGGLFQLNIILYARKTMELNHILSSLLMVALALGIGIGSMLAGKFSNKKIDLSFVRLGAIGIGLFSILLGFIYFSFPVVLGCLFFLGIFSGFYIVPLNALLQRESPPTRRGQVLATNNLLSFSSILLASVMLFVFRDVLHLAPQNIFFLTGVMTFLGIIYIYLKIDLRG